MVIDLHVVMDEALDQLVMKVAHAVVSNIMIFNIVCNNCNWMSIDAYVVIDWVQVPLLLAMQHVVDGGGATNLTNIIVGVAMV